MFSNETFQFILIIVAVVFVMVIEAIRLISIIKDSTKEERLKMIKSWLLSVIISAEKIYGGKTGKIKLSYVYGLFIEKFPKLAKIISFETFSALVDEVLKINENFVDNAGTSINVDTGITGDGVMLLKTDINEGI